MLMDCFVAFGAMLSAPFQADGMFPYPEEKVPLVMLRTLDSSNPAAGGRSSGCRACQHASRTSFGLLAFFFPPSPIRLNEMEPFADLDMARVQPAPSPGAEGLK